MVGGEPTRLYVGNVSKFARERDLEDLFKRHGRIRELSVRGAFGFVEFEDERDADDAVRALDGYKIEGEPLRVERSRPAGRAEDRTEKRGDPSTDRCFNCGEYGHWSRTCPDPPGRGQRSRRYDDNRCFTCGRDGHRARDCTYGFEQRGAPAPATTNGGAYSGGGSGGYGAPTGGYGAPGGYGGGAYDRGGAGGSGAYDRGGYDRAPPAYDRAPPAYDRAPPAYDRGAPAYDRGAPYDRAPPAPAAYDRAPPPAYDRDYDRDRLRDRDRDRIGGAGGGYERDRGAIGGGGGGGGGVPAYDRDRDRDRDDRYDRRRDDVGRGYARP